MPKTRYFCVICKGSNDGRSDICTRPACLAKYWRHQAELIQQRAAKEVKECIKRAEGIERDAALPVQLLT